MQVAPSGGQFNPSHGVNFWVRCASGNVLYPVCLLWCKFKADFELNNFSQRGQFKRAIREWPMNLTFEPLVWYYHHPTSYWNHVLGLVCPSKFNQSSITTTTPPRIGIMYWVWSVRQCLTSQAPLPPPHLVLELCIGLGLSVKVWPVKHHYHHPTSYWNYVLG